jgi:hypothetical protein
MMRHRVIVALGAALLLCPPTIVGDPPAVPAIAPIVRVLDVSKVDRGKQQILFYQTAEIREVVEEDGKKIARVRSITIAAAFSLRRGKAMTAGGKALSPDEVLRRLERGGLVAVMRDMGKPEEGEEDPSLKYRKLFKHDTIFLIGDLEAVK